MKKFLSAILASAMILALAVPALAATGVEEDTETKGATVTINGTVQAVALQITYADAGAVTLNPYRVAVGGKTDQVIGTSSKVTNATDKVPIVGTIKAKATTEGDIILLGGPVNDESIAKEAFLFLDVYGAKDQTSDGEAFAAYSDFDGTTFTAAENRIVLGEGDNEKVDRFYLDPPSGSNKELNYIVMGNTASKCSTWDGTNDKVTVEVVFSWKRTGNVIST